MFKNILIKFCLNLILKSYNIFCDVDNESKGEVA